MRAGHVGWRFGRAGPPASLSSGVRLNRISFMTPLLASLQFIDFMVIAFIVLVFGGGAALVGRQRVDLRRLDRKLDALLKHQGIPRPPIVSEEVQQVLRDRTKKSEAIKLHREQTGLDLEDAIADVEAFMTSKH